MFGSATTTGDRDVVVKQCHVAEATPREGSRVSAVRRQIRQERSDLTPLVEDVASVRALPHVDRANSHTG